MLRYAMLCYVFLAWEALLFLAFREERSLELGLAWCE